MSVLEKHCRSRVEGQLEEYQETVGGQLLLNAVQSKNFAANFKKRGKENQEKEIFFVEVYPKKIVMLKQNRQARVRFLEKLVQGSKSWTRSYTAFLEIIDGEWRVITLNLERSE